MPDAGLATILPAVTSIAGAGIQANTAAGATAAQQQANQQALAYQREQDDVRRQQYDQAMQNWMAGRQALAEHYGLTLPQMNFTPTAPSIDEQRKAKADAAAQNQGQGGLMGFMNSQQGQMLQALSPVARQGMTLAGILGLGRR